MMKKMILTLSVVTTMLFSCSDTKKSELGYLELGQVKTEQKNLDKLNIDLESKFNLDETSIELSMSGNKYLKLRLKASENNKLSFKDLSEEIKEYLNQNYSFISDYEIKIEQLK